MPRRKVGQSSLRPVFLSTPAAQKPSGESESPSPPSSEDEHTRSVLNNEETGNDDFEPSKRQRKRRKHSVHDHGSESTVSSEESIKTPGDPSIPSSNPDVCFMKLPFELRMTIWEFCLPPRVIRLQAVDPDVSAWHPKQLHVYTNAQYKKFALAHLWSPAPAPIILFICREAHDLVRKRYVSLGSVFSKRPKNGYSASDLETIHWKWWGASEKSVEKQKLEMYPLAWPKSLLRTKGGRDILIDVKQDVLFPDTYNTFPGFLTVLGFSEPFLKSAIYANLACLQLRWIEFMNIEYVNACPSDPEKIVSQNGEVVALNGVEWIYQNKTESHLASKRIRQHLPLTRAILSMPALKSLRFVNECTPDFWHARLVLERLKNDVVRQWLPTRPSPRGPPTFDHSKAEFFFHESHHPQRMDEVLEQYELEFKDKTGVARCIELQWPYYTDVDKNGEIVHHLVKE